jgi:chemotaxis protein methyltransferase CheR
MRAAAGPKLRERVVEAMTTNETLFFRDINPFEGLKQAIIPEMTARSNPRKVFRVWSAACSSGQEAYSIAMLWNEMHPPGWQLQILGTDLSQEMLDRAASGRYLQFEVNRGLPAVLLVKNFEREGEDWVIKDEIRQMARWKKFNLTAANWRCGPFEVIFCRNVLIYFDQPTRAKILAHLFDCLAPGGYLFLGAGETTLGLSEKFIRTQAGPAIAYRRPDSSET